jgi:hypothetical protein
MFGGQFGGARRNRTDDILLARQALSLLSYGPVMVVHKDGIEPPTRAPSTRRSTAELLVRFGVSSGIRRIPAHPRGERGPGLSSVLLRPVRPCRSGASPRSKARSPISSPSPHSVPARPLSHHDRRVVEPRKQGRAKTRARSSLEAPGDIRKSASEPQRGEGFRPPLQLLLRPARPPGFETPQERAPENRGPRRVRAGPHQNRKPGSSL